MAKTESQKPDLYFFQFPDDALKDDGVASALQSFETAVMLIGFGRWPSIIPLLWGSCEALLRVKYPQSKTDKIVDIQNRLHSEGIVKDGLHKEAHRLRGLRNEIIHSGYMPRDTPKCIELFFNAAVPYLDCLLTEVTGHGLYDKLYPKNEIWEVFKNTRKVVTKKINKNGQGIENAMTFLILAVRQTFSPKFIPGELLAIQESEFELEAIWYAGREIRKEIINEISGSNSDYCFELSGVGCPLCGQNVLASVSWESKGDSDRFVGLILVGCHACGYVVRDPDLINVFFKNQLSNELIAELESNNPPVAS